MYHNLYGKLKKYFEFSRTELIYVLIASVLFSFMLSFRDWGLPQSRETISISYGLYTWLISACIFFIFYLLYLLIIKCMAIWKGFVMEFKISAFLVLFALLLTFMSDGLFVLLIPGALYYKVLKKQRLGKIHQGMQYTTVGYVGATAALVLVMIAALFAPLFYNSIIFQKLVIINLLIAVFSMLPIPYTSGFYLIISSFLGFFTLLFAVLIAALFAYLEAGFLFSLVIAFFAGVFAWILTYRYLD